MFVDLHTHILSGVDDGAKNMAVSLEMLNIAANNGTAHILATPHYIHDTVNNLSSLVMAKCSELAFLATEKGMDICVCPGSEVFISPETPELVEAGTVCTLNRSSYVLLEFPMGSLPLYTAEVLYRLKLKGFTPIIAHPERNREIAGNPNLLYDYIQRGALAQVNSTSLTGLYGRRVRQTALTILNHGMMHFVASDAHTCNGRSPKLKTAYELVTAEAGEETAVRLFIENGHAVLENQPIVISEPERVKAGKSFFFSTIRDVIMQILK